MCWLGKIFIKISHFKCISNQTIVIVIFFWKWILGTRFGRIIIFGSRLFVSIGTPLPSLTQLVVSGRLGSHTPRRTLRIGNNLHLLTAEFYFWKCFLSIILSKGMSSFLFIKLYWILAIPKIYKFQFAAGHITHSLKNWLLRFISFTFAFSFYTKDAQYFMKFALWLYNFQS